MHRIKIICLYLAILFTFTNQANASSDTQVEINKCLLKALQRAHDSTTVAELKAKCTQLKSEVAEPAEQEAVSLSEILGTEKKATGVISKRAEAETATAFNPYVITPHKMNYILPVSVSDGINRGVYEFTNGWSENMEDTESKLQLSFKVPVNTSDIFVKNDKLFFGFTLKSWWQVYSDNISKPFRETNYQPEFFYSTPLDVSYGETNSAFMIGIEHQSNGRALPLSRSWNRVYLNWLFEYDNFALSFKPWYRLPENKKASPLDVDGDDNPDIDDYMGYFQLGMAYQWDDYEFNFQGHHNFSTSRGGAEIGVTFPIWGRLRGYAQYFGGYGESLIDYNHSQHRFGIGIALTDLL